MIRSLLQASVFASCILIAATAGAQSSTAKKRKVVETEQEDEAKPAAKKPTGVKAKSDDEEKPSTSAKKSAPPAGATSSTSNKKPVAKSDEDEPASTSKSAASTKSTSSRTKAAASEDDSDKKPVGGFKNKSASGEVKADAEDETPHSAKSKKKADVPEASVDAPPKETKPATPPATPGGTGAPPAYIDSADLKNFGEQPERVKAMIESALVLSRQGLTYKYGSDDPASGGMDCSGSIAYLLREQGFKDVPRDASSQYTWARKNGTFFAVVSKSSASFEFKDLMPGDIMFWSGTYAVDRDPPVTHSMIYLGEHKSRKQRVMWGSSDGRTYDGKSRYGVGVFDFRMPKTGGEGEGASASGKSPDFLGYARIPGLREAVPATTQEPAVESPKSESAKGESTETESKNSGATKSESTTSTRVKKSSEEDSPKSGSASSSKKRTSSSAKSR